MKIKNVFYFLFSLAFIMVIGQMAVAKAAVTEAPLLADGSPGVMSGRYIVVFKPGTSKSTVQTLISSVVLPSGGRVYYEYYDALIGFAASMSGAALSEIRRNPAVKFVERDRIIQITTDQINPPSWGLDRIDQPDLPLDNIYTYNYDGTGVTVYIIDTGIYIGHNDFGGRASYGHDFIDDDPIADDCHGHGTHVAGTVGGTTYGVAKNVSLVAVRVLNCSGAGSYSQVIAGINWVTTNHTGGLAVANMSLGGSPSVALDSAVISSIKDHIIYTVSAGGSNANACNFSPARVPNALTVGATTPSDARSSSSNWGSCLDLFAPGLNITSAWIGDPNASNTLSGTSMASPHVAGAAALYLEQYPSGYTHLGTSIKTIISNTAVNKVSNPGTGSPNRLLQSAFPYPPPPP
ncbi:MAG: S8 family peptidase, partial [Anaerolineales bacterium]